MCTGYNFEKKNLKLEAVHEILNNGKINIIGLSSYINRIKL